MNVREENGKIIISDIESVDDVSYTYTAPKRVRIIHGSIPLQDNGSPALTIDQLELWVNHMQKSLPDDVKFVYSPFQNVEEVLAQTQRCACKPNLKEDDNVE